MKNCILLSIVLMICVVSFCQAEWKLANESGSYNTLCSISFANDRVGYMTGLGNIKKTTDGGKNWKTVFKRNGNKYIHKVFVLNPDTLWANGESSVFRSFNGGVNWDTLFVDSLEYSDAYTIQFSANGRGTAFDKSGIYESEDYGETWRQILLPEIRISSFAKIGADSIIIASMYDIFRSTDWGQTWSFLKKCDIQMLFCQGNNAIIAMLGDGSVQKSTDFGANWTDLYIPTKTITPTAIHKIDESKWFISYAKGIKAYTTNAGESWIEPQNKGLIGISYGAGWTGANSIYMVGESGGIFESSDMGESWTCRQYSVYCNFSKVQFIDSLHVWSIGSLEITHSTDGGLNWFPVYTSTANYITNLSFVSDSIGFVADEVGVIYKTTDGGSNWETFQIDEENTTFGAFLFFSKDTGIVASTAGRIYRTTDGCKTWKCVNTNISLHRLNSFFALDRNHVWAAGGFGRVLFSEDTGATWSILPTQTTDYYQAIQFVDPMHGWAVGEIGLVARTCDGGYSWTTDTIPGMPSLFHVDFVNKDTGWVAGLQGSIFVSTNSGHTWHQQATPTSRNIVSLNMNQDLTGMAYGSYHTILRYTPDSVLAPPDTITTSVGSSEASDFSVFTANGCNELIVSSPAGTLSNLRILGMLGNEVMRTEMSELNYSNRLSIDISLLPSGLYLLRARRDGEEVSMKFIISR